MHSRVLPGGKMLHLCTTYKTQSNFLEHECQYSAYFKFLCFIWVQTYKSHILEGCAMVLAMGDCPCACSYSECGYIQITRYIFSPFTIPEAWSDTSPPCPTSSHFPCAKHTSAQDRARLLVHPSCPNTRNPEKRILRRTVSRKRKGSQEGGVHKTNTF